LAPFRQETDDGSRAIKCAFASTGAKRRHKRTHPHRAATQSPPPWKEASNASREYLSVKLDDPTFAGPRFVTRVAAAGDGVRAISGPGKAGDRTHFGAPLQSAGRFVCQRFTRFASQRHLYSIPQLRGVAGVVVSDEAQLIVSSNRGENTIGIFPPRRDPQVSKTRGPQSAQGNGSCRITQKEAEHEMGDT